MTKLQGDATTEHLFMQRALELAAQGMGKVSPNPMVGCVIVKEGQIIGEGFHQRFGEAHAEVNAVNSVKDQKLLQGATVYVSLEPCAHFGKTPPCANLLVESKVKKVVICNLDPNPKVAGKGIKILENAGIEVKSGLLNEAGTHLNRQFFTFHIKKRPFVVLKWAQTQDGFVARNNFDSKWISNEQSRQLGHKIRANSDAILIGSNTAKYDNPSLTTRDWFGHNPVRLVIDPRGALEPGAKVLSNDTSTYVFTKTKPKHPFQIQLFSANWVTEILEFTKNKDLQTIMVEGGSTTLNHFITQNLWDEAHVFIGDTKFTSGILAPKLDSKWLRQTVEIKNDVLNLYTNDYK